MSAMTPREASIRLDGIKDLDLSELEKMALIRAKQALDILATLEEGLRLNEPVTIEQRSIAPTELEWTATRGGRTHLGTDVTDALGQLCMTLALERHE
jgi:hypothetical protein